MRSVVLAFEERYVDVEDGVEEPDPLLLQVHEIVGAAQDLEAALRGAWPTSPCALCDDGPGEHTRDCPITRLTAALVAEAEE